MSTCPSVPQDADIAGIGVRIAVYIQAALSVISSFLQEGDPSAGRMTEGPLSNSPLTTLHDPGATPPVHDEAHEAEKRQSVFAKDSPISPYSTSMRIEDALPVVTSQHRPSQGHSRPTPQHRSSSQLVEWLLNPRFAQNADRDLERSLFVTGCAFVICAFIQISANTSSGGLTDYHALVVLNLSFINYWAGIDLLRRRTDPERKAKVRSSEGQAEEGPGERGVNDGFHWYKPSVPFTNLGGAWLTIGSWLPFYLQATLFSILGIIFWMRQDLFQGYLGAGCTTPTIYWTFQPIPVTSRSLKIVSLMFYFLSVIPIVNGVFTQLLSICVAGILAAVATVVTLPLLFAYVILSILLTILWHSCRSPGGNTWEQHGIVSQALSTTYRYMRHFHRLNRRTTTVVYTGPIVYWIIATEMLVRSNAPYAADNKNSKQWTYGQVMSLLTACMVIAFYSLQVIEKMQEKKDHATPAASSQVLQTSTPAMPTPMMTSPPTMPLPMAPPPTMPMHTTPMPMPMPTPTSHSPRVDV